MDLGQMTQNSLPSTSCMTIQDPSGPSTGCAMVAPAADSRVARLRCGFGVRSPVPLAILIFRRRRFLPAFGSVAYRKNRTLLPQSAEGNLDAKNSCVGGL